MWLMLNFFKKKLKFTWVKVIFTHFNFSRHIHIKLFHHDECLYINNRNYWRCLMMICESNEKCVKQTAFGNCSLIHIFLGKFVFNNALNLWHLLSSLPNIGVDWFICSLLFCYELCFTPLESLFVNLTEKSSLRKS